METIKWYWSDSTTDNPPPLQPTITIQPEIFNIPSDISSRINLEFNIHQKLEMIYINQDGDVIKKRAEITIYSISNPLSALKEVGDKIYINKRAVIDESDKITIKFEGHQAKIKKNIAVIIQNEAEIIEKIGEILANTLPNKSKIVITCDGEIKSIGVGEN